ncbi:MAG: hypothetical protein AB7G75_08830 [Candidatus Binatia bacterium]
MAMFLLIGSLGAVTIATVVYRGFPRPETRFALVVTLLLVYALLTLAPLVFLRPLEGPAWWGIDYPIDGDRISL